jgi:hypothetical protein
MAALPAPVDPVPALSPLSFATPLTDTSHARAMPAVPEAARPRIRRLVVFTGKIT